MVAFSSPSLVLTLTHSLTLTLSFSHKRSALVETTTLFVSSSLLLLLSYPSPSSFVFPLCRWLISSAAAASASAFLFVFTWMPFSRSISLSLALSLALFFVSWIIICWRSHVVKVKSFGAISPLGWWCCWGCWSRSVLPGRSVEGCREKWRNCPCAGESRLVHGRKLGWPCSLFTLLGLCFFVHFHSDRAAHFTRSFGLSMNRKWNGTKMWCWVWGWAQSCACVIGEFKAFGRHTAQCTWKLGKKEMWSSCDLKSKPLLRIFPRIVTFYWLHASW